MQKNIVIAVLGLLLSLTLISCSGKRKTQEVKSPCVSNPGGPCGPKRSVNDWWIENGDENTPELEV